MTKSYELDLLEVCLSILADAKIYFPDSQGEFERDKTRLISLVKSRGQGLFTLDLPALGKHFDQCISKGLYTQIPMPLMRRRKPGSVIPRLFQGLLIKVFDDTGVVRQDVDVTAVFFLRQLYAFAKKFRYDCAPSKVYKAVREFVDIEESLPEPTLNWASDSFEDFEPKDLTFMSFDPSDNSRIGNYPTGITPKLLEWLQGTCDHIALLLGNFDPIGSEPGHGPGAVADMDKYGFKYQFPYWSDRLEAVFPYADLGFANYAMWADDPDIKGDWKVNSNQSFLIAVPKSQKTPRLIAKEPVANQYCQQAIWRFLRNRTERSHLGGFIAFGDQSFNQEGALLASRDENAWTIDLSSASDRLTTRFVERMFRLNKPLLNALHASRTPLLIQEIDKKCPREIPLRKFSTQGSACTFPVESLAFLAISLACVLYVRAEVPNHNSIRNLRGKVRVFGDDIIVPDYAGELTRSLLGYLFFKVNEEKTFGIGSFRESCGLDVYKGENVTPAYFIRVPSASKPESIVSCVETSNNFFKKGLWRTARKIQETVGDRRIATVQVDSGLFGWCSYTGYDFISARWNRFLHRVEYDALILRDKSSRTRVNHHGSLLQYFQEKPKPDTFWSSGKKSRPKLKLTLGRVIVR